MPDSTPLFAVPYPLPEDAVVDYPALGSSLAAKIEELLTAPTCRVYSTVDLPVSGTSTVLAFNADRWDSGGMHDPAALNSRVIATRAGVYVVTFNAIVVGVGPGSGYGRILVNGGVWADQMLSFANAPGNLQQRLSMSTIVPLAVGDRVEAAVSLIGVASATVQKSPPTSAELSVAWLGPTPSAPGLKPAPEDELEAEPKA